MFTRKIFSWYIFEKLIRTIVANRTVCLFQFDDEDIEEDAPLERRKKIFTKECKYMQLTYYTNQKVSFKDEEVL